MILSNDISCCVVCMSSKLSICVCVKVDKDVCVQVDKEHPLQNRLIL